MRARSGKKLSDRIKWSYHADTTPEEEPKESKKMANVQELLEQYPTVIAKPNEPPGQTNVIQHEIHLTDTRPIAQRPYKIRDPAKVDFLRNELAKWKRDGIIQETKSPWASPLVLVEKTKKETAGELRICADFHGINKITK